MNSLLRKTKNVDAILKSILVYLAEIKVTVYYNVRNRNKV